MAVLLDVDISGDWKVSVDGKVDNSRFEQRATTTDELECPICLTDFEEVAEIVITGCSHSFCRICFSKLELLRKPCAMCRAELSERILHVIPIQDEFILMNSASCAQTAFTTLSAEEEEVDGGEVKDDNVTIIARTSFMDQLDFESTSHHVVSNSTAAVQVQTPSLHPQPYSLSIIERIITGVRNLYSQKGVLLIGNISYIVYDIVSRSILDEDVVYERHISLPISRKERMAPYISKLIKNASSFIFKSYSDHSHSPSTIHPMHISNRFIQITEHARHPVKSYEDGQKNGSSMLPWGNYRFIDHDNQIYAQSVPSV